MAAPLRRSDGRGAAGTQASAVSRRAATPSLSAQAITPGIEYCVPLITMSVNYGGAVAPRSTLRNLDYVPLIARDRRRPSTSSTLVSHALADGLLRRRDRLLVALVHGPALDAFRA